jgi:hypothetical protein
MTTEPNAELADKTRAYLTAHGWTAGEPGVAGALWNAPDGRQVAVPHWLAADELMFRHLVTVVADLECRQQPVVVAEIINPDGEAPAYTFARAWTWTRAKGTDVEILADTETRLCARKAATEADGALRLAAEWEADAAELDRNIESARNSEYTSAHEQARIDREIARTLRECATALRETATEATP